MYRMTESLRAPQTGAPRAVGPAGQWRADFRGRLEIAIAAQAMREGRAIGQRGLARRLSVDLGETLSFSKVHRWLTGEAEPTAWQLAALGRVLACSPAWLAFGASSAAADARDAEFAAAEQALSTALDAARAALQRMGAASARRG